MFVAVSLGRQAYMLELKGHSNSLHGVALNQHACCIDKVAVLSDRVSQCQLACLMEGIGQVAFLLPGGMSD